MAQPTQPNAQITDQQRQALASITPPKNTKDQRTSTQNHLMFSEIRDNIVIMRDGSLRMVIMASAVNFDLKSSREQDAIEYAYQGFLNGLHFPVQIIVRSRKIDLDNYLGRLEGLQAEQSNQLLAGLMEDYIFNIRGLLEDVNIMAKSFYVVIPYYIQAVSKDNIVSKITGLLKQSEDVVESSEDFEKHKRDLIQRTNIVAQGLAQIGVRAAVLTTQELVELYYGSYNIDEAQSQPLVGVDELNAPVVGREGAPLQPHGPAQKVAEPEDMFAAARRASPMPTPQQAQHAVAAVAPQAAPAAAPVIQAQPAAPAPATTPASTQPQQQAQPGQAVQIARPNATPQQPPQGGQQ
jgi:hypothetical protein